MKIETSQYVDRDGVLRNNMRYRPANLGALGLGRSPRKPSQKAEVCEDKRLCNGTQCSACQNNLRRATKRR